MQSPFVKYVRHGWRLIPLEIGDKLPRQRGWNREELTLSEPKDVEGVQSAGLAHAYSGTCAIDIDDVKASREYLKQFDINLKAMFMAPDAVRILSGRKNRTKLLYQLPDPLQSIKIIAPINGIQTNIIDFRCATSNLLTVQDALPPSMHPKTRKPYRWSYGNDLTGDWRNLPVLPENVLAFWMAQIHERNAIKEKTDIVYSADELTDLLKGLDPDVDYNQWLKIGMAVHDASSGSREGIEIWDEWSAQGSKYKGKKDLVPHWRSFRGSGITVDYLLMHQIADIEVFDDITSTEKVKKRKKFESIPISEWVKRPPPKWIIHDTLPQSDLAMMYGASGSGKSFFAMDLALSIATGTRWRDKDTAQGTVLWIAAEAAGSMINRAKAYAQHYGTKLTNSFRIMIETPDLNMVEHVRDIGIDARKHKPLLIVVDTLTAASGGANENSGQDMAKILAACRALHKISKALILLIHHSGKDVTKGARGWSGIKAAMQTEIEINLLESGERIAKIVKQRDGEQDIEFPFQLLPIDLPDSNGVAQSSCIVEAQEGVFMVEMIVESEWSVCAAMGILSQRNDRVSTVVFKNILSDLAEELELDELDVQPSMLSQYFTDTEHFKVGATQINLLDVRQSVDEEF